MRKSVKKINQLEYLQWALLIASLTCASFLISSHPSFASDHQNSTYQNSTLTIYAYESLLNWGLDPNETNSKVFDAFEVKEDCTIELAYFPDVGATLAQAVAEKNSPRGDIIIGIDNAMIYEAKAQDILLPYEPSTSSNLSISAINGLDPDFYVTPYDYGFIAIIYHKNLVNSTTVPSIDNLHLSNLTDPKIAQMFITEDPTLSSTGLGFLMWTIGIYEKVLQSDWEPWWNATRKDIQIEDSWGDAFDIFYNPAVNRPIMVSYATDPAYSYLFYNDTSIGATVSHENNSNYAWLQIEGIGILKGSNNVALAQKFIDWFTSETIQELVPENNWMYPANSHAELPDSFDYAIDPTTVTPLNDLFTPEEISSSLDSWQETWEQIIILGYTVPLTTVETTSFQTNFFPLLAIVYIGIRKKNKKKR